MAAAWVLYGDLSGENRVSRWIRYIDPPCRLGSTAKAGLMAVIRGPRSRMNCRNGASTSATYRSRFASNQSRLLLDLRSRRNVNRVGAKCAAMAQRDVV